MMLELQTLRMLWELITDDVRVVCTLRSLEELQELWEQRELGKVLSDIWPQFKSCESKSNGGSQPPQPEASCLLSR